MQMGCDSKQWRLIPSLKRSLFLELSTVDTLDEEYCGFQTYPSCILFTHIESGKLA